MAFDSSGLLLSRLAFEQVADLSSIQTNLIRCTGALITFAVIGMFKPIHLVSGWRKLKPNSRLLAVSASVVGCYLSLVLYLTAVKIGHMASVSAIGLAGPILTSIGECVYLRKWPSPYLVVALCLFSTGFAILTII